MEFEKVKFFHNYLKSACEAFYGAIEHKTLGEAQINNQIITFGKTDFHHYYYNFLSELRANSTEIQDLEIIYEYVRCGFDDIIKWEGFESNINQIIVTSQFEIKYLKELKENIVCYLDKIRELAIRDKYGEVSEALENRFDSYLRNEDNNQSHIEFENLEEEQKRKDIRLHLNYGLYDFTEVQLDSEQIEDLVDRINFLEDRLKSYRQIQNKKKKDEIEKILISQDVDFEKLCVLEIESLCRKLDLDLKTNAYRNTQEATVKTEKNVPDNLIWKSTGTDLLELLAALHLNKSIQRIDGEVLTRKDLIEAFETFLKVKIKDPQGSLARATNRKMNTTPFLDKLKIIFGNYAEDKLDKPSRK